MRPYSTVKNLKSGLFFTLLGLFISCAEKRDQAFNEEAVIYQASLSDEKSQYLTCNVFSDQTFRGYLFSDSESSYIDSECIYLEILKSPQELLKNSDLFLQIYPFKTTKKDIEYGHSLPIKTLKNSSQTKQAIARSQIIDTHFVETVLDLPTESFFADHYFEICDITEDWEGLQLVIYERRENREVPPIRISKFLLPPFLIHPEHFRDVKGEALAAFHPFLKYIPELKSRPSAYYRLAEDICEDL